MKFKLDLTGLTREQLQDMASAGREIREAYRVIAKAGSNIVARVLEHQGTFYEEDHYPKGDVYDDETKSQYYYHAHRPDSGEHGHFHTFVRAAAIPDSIAPAPYEGKAERPLGDDAICHLVAISMNKPGFPVGLFTTNRWVTAETFYAAADAERILAAFKIDHVYPCLAVNRWISAMMRLFRPQIAALLEERDRAVARWQKSHPDRDVFEDRELEITSILPIDVDQQIAAVERALAGLGTRVASAAPAITKS